MAHDFVDLFAGCGGWDVAAHALGRTVLGVELWEPAIRTRQEAKLDTWISGNVLDCDPCGPGLAAHSLIASPPCQTFSSAGKGVGRAEIKRLQSAVLGWNNYADLDEGAALTLEPLRWVRRRLESGLPYRAVLLEQVPQVQPIWDAYAAVLERLGYSVWTGVLSVENFSVPQTRKRAILLASQEKTMSDPMHTCAKPIAWNEALGITNPLAVLESNYKGGSSKPEGGKWPLGIRAFGQPSFTITGKLHKIRVLDQVTRLTPAQSGMLQTFPADFPWQGTLSDQSLQAGNAIPVAFAEALLLHIL